MPRRCLGQVPEGARREVSIICACVRVCVCVCVCMCLLVNVVLSGCLLYISLKAYITIIVSAGPDREQASK